MKWGMILEQDNKKRVSLEEIYPIIKEKLENGGTVQLPITGTSMLPLLIQSRDSVIISPVEKLNINDIVFYRRNDGHFVLHRIVGKDEKGYILCGDNQVKKEYGITNQNIIGVVTELHIKGKIIKSDNAKYVKYCKFWLKALPYRYPIIALYNILFNMKK